MGKLSRIALLTVICVLPAFSRAAPSQTTKLALHDIQTIYVDDMGSSDEAVRFRLLLEDAIAKQSFKVADSADHADAVLSGIVSIVDSGYYGVPNDIGVTVKLTTADGHRVWTGNSGGQIVRYNPIPSIKPEEPILHRARELAKKLRTDWQKSAKPHK